MNFFIITIFILLCIILNYLLHNFFLEKSKTFKINKAYQKAVRWNNQKKPIAGGISFYLSYIFASIFFLLITQKPNFLIDVQYFYIAIALTFIFFVGLADDMLSISPKLKFVLQASIAFILVIADIKINIFDNDILNLIFSLLWLIGITNSINMLDNMDGSTTASSIPIIVSFIILNVFVFKNTYELFILISIILSLVIFFFFFNRHPASMYMGDNGSLFLGNFLGIFAIKYLWNFPIYEHSVIFKAVPFLLIALIFIIPLTDTFTVIINRILQKRSPFIGGKDHTTHALYYLGLSENSIAILLFLIELIASVFVIYICLINFENKPILIISLIYTIFVALFLYINAYHKHIKNKRKDKRIK